MLIAFTGDGNSPEGLHQRGRACGKETTMATDFEFSLENQPGTGAKVLTALGDAGVNVIGVAAVSGGATVHLAVESSDEAQAREALERTGVSISRVTEVVVVPAEDRPGAGADLLRRVRDAGANLEFVYLATNTRVVLGSDNPDAVRSAVSA
jgi:hypothetical protein